MIPSAINNKYISLIYGNNMCREEWDNTSFEIGYTIALLILLLVGPVVTMTIAYMLIAVTLWIGMKMDTQNELGNTFSVCLCLCVCFISQCNQLYTTSLFHHNRTNYFCARITSYYSIVYLKKDEM